MPTTFWEASMFVADSRAWAHVGPGLATPLADIMAPSFAAILN